MGPWALFKKVTLKLKTRYIAKLHRRRNILGRRHKLGKFRTEETTKKSRGTLIVERV